jgi:TPR repeat protein
MQTAFLYRKAATQGNGEAQKLLGGMYAFGDGVPQDDAQAAMWLRKAAEQGDAEAQFEVGTMYFAGRGVPQDFVQTHMWFNLAAAGAPSAEARDRAVKARDGLAHMMTPDQLAEAQRLAREWQPTK